MDKTLAAFHEAGIYLADEEADVEVRMPGFYIATHEMVASAEDSDLTGWTRRGLIAGEYEIEHEPPDRIRITGAKP